MRLYIAAFLAFFAASTYTFSQERAESLQSQDSSSSQVTPNITLLESWRWVQPAEVTWVDQVAAARDLLVNPSRIESYWPEYLYDLNDITRSCRSYHPRDFDLGDTELLLSQNAVKFLSEYIDDDSDGQVELPFSQDTIDLLLNLLNSQNSEQENDPEENHYAVPISVNLSDVFASNSNLSNVLELCRFLSDRGGSLEQLQSVLREENVGHLEQSVEFNIPLVSLMTSEVFPDSGIEFQHVRLERFNPQQVN